ncbi:hypothetical protein [Terrabacter carboxydivorans]|uniref:DUF222 domain-containing protein n=1 Tax=Terrabacter carboxydivorans TaxID=619730 RepID=A0ABP5Y197_9MICO
MTIRFNPPPGWPVPPPTWVPHDDWLPEPDWPEPPTDWTFWSVTAPPRRASGDGDGRGDRTGSRPRRVSFPLATVAAQSTVSLAVLFPERGRQGGTAYGSSAADAPPTKAGREYYQPGGRTEAARRARAGAGGALLGGSVDDGHLGSELNGSEFHGSALHGAVLGGSSPNGSVSNGSGSNGSVSNGSGSNGSVLNGSAGVLVDELSAAPGHEDEPGSQHTSQDESQHEGVMTPGIRLSPLLRLVAHPSGLRVQFRVGGPVAEALAEVMTPAIEAATPGLATRPPSTDDVGRGTSAGRPKGLRWRLRGRRTPDAGDARTEPGQATHQPSDLSIHDLARRALAARHAGDRDEALAVERDLRSLHRVGFVTIRPPVAAPFAPLSGAEAADIRDRVLAATGATAAGLPRARAAELRALAAERAESLLAASDVARRVLADRRAALATGAWQLLRAHDPAAVVAVVDEALRLSGSDVTCLDAGTDPVTGRAYVTVLVRFPTIGIVAEEQRDDAPAGRPGWRPRTARERNIVYAAGLASAVLAAAKQAVSIAPATDDVNVVVVRPTRNGRGVEPVYVGRFDREDVSLRHPDADPLPLVTSSAMPHGIRVHGPDREVTALEHAADRDGALRELVDTCRAADARGRSARDA